jgi:hypothetical protein
MKVANLFGDVLAVVVRVPAPTRCSGRLGTLWFGFSSGQLRSDCL